MSALLRVLTALLLAAGLAFPLSAGATGLSFGGRVLTINYCANGAVQFLIKPAGRFPISYIWLPFATRVNMFSPVPAKPPFFGQQTLGVALPVPYTCFGPGVHPASFVGLPVEFEGTSLTI